MVTVIGYGAMARALIEAFCAHNIEVEVVGRDEEKLKSLQKEYPSINVALLHHYNITKKDVILAVKPYALEAVAQNLRGKADLLLSLLAGIPLESLRAIPAMHYIRAMPNIAASKGASTTVLTGDEKAKERAIALCSTFGEAIWIESEKELDIATAIVGSGPAFLALVAEAMADGGVVCGLRRELALRLVAGLFQSSAVLLQESSPTTIKDSVMSPAGTTAAGYTALEQKGVRGAFIEAIRSAFMRASKSS